MQQSQNLLTESYANQTIYAAQSVLYNLELQQTKDALPARDAKKTRQKGKSDVLLMKGLGRVWTQDVIIEAKRQQEESRKQEEIDKVQRANNKEDLARRKKEVKEEWEQIKEDHQIAVGEWEERIHKLTADRVPKKNFPPKPKRPKKPSVPKDARNVPEPEAVLSERGNSSDEDEDKDKDENAEDI